MAWVMSNVLAKQLSLSDIIQLLEFARDQLATLDFGEKQRTFEATPETASPSPDSGPAPITVRLRPCDRLALNQSEYAQLEDSGLATDRDAYDWLKECNGVDDLRSFETWARYLRRARKALGKQKNLPRRGRPLGSVVGSDQL